ncbi:MAG: hypothetical protein AAGB19_15375 [Cyanobacteria bacterium P01_F01_bin.3]
MTERLDRIEAALEASAAQQTKNSSDIEALIGVASTNDAAIRELTANVDRVTTATAEGNQRFEVLRQDAIADRRELSQRFDDLADQMNADRRATRQHFDEMASELKADRSQNQQHFDELAAQMNRDRAAQTEILQGLLLELSQMKGRIIALEQKAS